MKTFYFIINHFVSLSNTLIIHSQAPELHLKPVRIKVDERPYNPGTRDTEQVKW